MLRTTKYTKWQTYTLQLPSLVGVNTRLICTMHTYSSFCYALLQLIMKEVLTNHGFDTPTPTTNEGSLH